MTHIRFAIKKVQKEQGSGGNGESMSGAQEAGANNENSSLKLFIDNCCQLSSFSDDYIEVIDFKEAYEEFCFINHLHKQTISEAELKNDYNVDIEFKPQQWVTRVTNSVIFSKKSKSQTETIGNNNNNNTIRMAS